MITRRVLKQFKGAGIRVRRVGASGGLKDEYSVFGIGSRGGLRPGFLLQERLWRRFGGTSKSSFFSENAIYVRDKGNSGAGIEGDGAENAQKKLSKKEYSDQYFKDLFDSKKPKKGLILKKSIHNPTSAEGKAQRAPSHIKVMHDFQNDHMNLAEEVQTTQEFFYFIKSKNFDFSLHEINLLFEHFRDLIKQENEKFFETKNLTTTFSTEDNQAISQLVRAAKQNLEAMYEEEQFLGTDLSELREQFPDPEDYSKALERWIEVQNAREEGEDYTLKYPRVGNLASTLSDLGIDDLNLWDTFTKFVIKQKYTSSVSECVKALEAFTYYQKNLENQELVEAYFNGGEPKNGQSGSGEASGGAGRGARQLPGRRAKKKTVLLQSQILDEKSTRKDRLAHAGFKLCKRLLYAMNDQEMTYYLSVAKSLNSLVPLLETSHKYLPMYSNLIPKLYEKLENQVVRNLSMKYSSQTILDIMHYFALQGRGSADFYEALQIVLVKGNMFQNKSNLLGNSGLGKNQISGSLSISLGLSEGVFSSKDNILKIVDCYNYAEQRFGTKEVIGTDSEIMGKLEQTFTQKGSDHPVEIYVDTKQLVLKEVSKLSNRTNFSLGELVKLYSSIEGPFKIQKDEFDPKLEKLLKKRLVDSLQKRVQLAEVIDFFNKIGFWKFDREETKKFMKVLDVRFLEGGVSYSQHDLIEYLDMFNRHNLELYGDKRVLELEAKDYIVNNFMRLESEEVAEMMRKIEALGQGSGVVEIGGGGDSEEVSLRYSEFKNKMLRLELL